MSPAARWLPISPAAGAADRQYPLATIATPCNQPDLSGSGPCTPLPLPLISRQTGSLHPFGGFGIRLKIVTGRGLDWSALVLRRTGTRSAKQALFPDKLMTSPDSGRGQAKLPEGNAFMGSCNRLRSESLLAGQPRRDSRWRDRLRKARAIPARPQFRGPQAGLPVP